MTTVDQRIAQTRVALENRQERLQAVGVEDRRVSAARGVGFVAGVLTALGAVPGRLWSPLWAVVPAVGFVLLVLRHAVIARRLLFAERALAFHEDALARLEGRWEGRGTPGDPALADAAHLYATELDLFGAKSLFERLATTRTGFGERLLADWLLAPAPPAVVVERQDAIRELVDRPGLREDLAVRSGDVRGRVAPGPLVEWADAALTIPGWAHAVAIILPSLSFLALLGVWRGWVPPAAAFGAILLQSSFALRFRQAVHSLVVHVEGPLQSLSLLAGLVARLDGERFAAPLLRRHHSRLTASKSSGDGTGVGASIEIARLRRLVALLDTRGNQLFAPVAAMMLWTTNLAFALERWKKRVGRGVGGGLGGWLEALGVLDALQAIAGYAWERPDDIWPHFDDGTPRIAATGLGHPLIPAASLVRNDLTLSREGARLLLVSGSNMSGKSTLLRTVGVNLVLAQVGAPVCATSLTLTPLVLGCAIQARDSLADGRSRFYAEITRLRQIMDLMEAGRPVLYLFDELLSGTNSHDRAIGARAVLQRLVEGGALGLVTTHDLALAEVADSLAPWGRNVHFVDTVEDGALRFDYRLRPGVVRHSNALDLMRAVGLLKEDLGLRT